MRKNSLIEVAIRSIFYLFFPSANTCSSTEFVQILIRTKCEWIDCMEYMDERANSVTAAN